MAANLYSMICSGFPPVPTPNTRLIPSMNMPSTLPELNAATLDALRRGELDTATQQSLFDQALAGADVEMTFEIADQLAYALWNAGQYDAARKVAERALQCGMDIPLLHTLALSEHALGEHKSAIAHMEQALQQH